MQKIYVLLRNDQQTGPYSLEEIIQFDLKPYDLIWIEGKSAGWYYPQEISALHPYLDFVRNPAAPAIEKTAEAKPVFVSMPAIAKNEAPPAALVTNSSPPREFFAAQRPAPAFASEAYKIAETPLSKNIEEDVYAQFKQPAEDNASNEKTATSTTPKKKATVSVGGSIAAVLIVGGVLAASWIMNRRPANAESTTAAYNVPPTQNETANTAVANEENTSDKKPASSPKLKTQQSKPTLRTKPVVVKQTTAPSNDPKVDANNPVEQPIDQGVATPKKNDPAGAKEETSTTPTEDEAQPEKKKKLRDKFLDLFKKKPEEQKTEGAKPVEAENGERRATRREDGADLTQMVSIRFDVPNDWMMGIKGAKAILVNRSNETVSKAMVEVLYYDDDNNLLQKKTITFSNVGGKDSKTVSIPDHSTATKVDYTIVSVTGKPGA